MKISEDFILKLKTSCDIYSIVSSYTELKSSGAIMRCCCPFHSEKTPSCFIYGSTQSFYCFGCGVGGDVITFIEKIENLPYVEAVVFLAQKVGMALPSNKSDDGADCFESNWRLRLLKINRAAAFFFHKALFSSKGADGLAYLKARGLLNKTIVQFGLGYSLNCWAALFDHLKAAGFSTNEILKSGLVLKSKTGKLYDKFRGRVMFPIVGSKGEVLGFGGRHLDGSGPKYLNSADSDVFRKGALLYGLNLAKKAYNESGQGRKNKFLILCEGYMDVISLHQNGFSTAVATLGTALTKQQVLLISRNSNEVLLSYDSDEAGQAATVRACSLFEQINFKVRVLNLKGAKDPDEFLKKYGYLRFGNLLKESVSFEQMFFDKIKAEYGQSNSEERRALVHKFCTMVSKMIDPLQREVYVSRACTEFGLAKNVVSAHVYSLIKKAKQKHRANLRLKLVASAKTSAGQNSQKSGAANLKIINASEGLIRAIFKQPKLVAELVGNFNSEWLGSGFQRKVFNFLVKQLQTGPVDLSTFREILNPEEFGSLTRILNEGDETGEQRDNLNNYIKILSDEFFKKKENVLKMSLSELELRRQKNAKLKF